MLELYFEPLARRSVDAYAEAFARYYGEMKSVEGIFGEGPFEQSFPTENRFVPMSFSCFMELYTRYPFISRHLRFGWLHFTNSSEVVQSWRKTVHFMCRKTVQFYWLKSVYFILPFTDIRRQSRAKRKAWESFPAQGRERTPNTVQSSNTRKKAP